MDRVPGLVTSVDESDSGLRQLIRDSSPRVLLGLAGTALVEIARTPQIAWQRRRILSNGQRAVGYVGWIGHGNLGDEAVFEAISAGMQARESLVPLLAPEGERILDKFGLGGFRFFRAVMFGGGTLIHPYYLPVGRLLKELGIPLYTVGTGVGSPGFFAPERPSVAGWKDILDESELLSVRGPLSQQRLRDVGLTNVEVIGDPALGLAPQRSPAFRSKHRLIINLAHEKRPVRGSNDYAVLSELARMAADFAQQGGELVGVALGARDRQALERFRREHRLSHFPIEDHHASTERFFQTVAGSIGVIGTRLHSAVLAACVGVPPILFAYRDKCNDFMESMELGDFAIDINAENSPARLRDAFERLRAETGLGPAIYRRALFWKEKQAAFYDRLADAVASGSATDAPS